MTSSNLNSLLYSFNLFNAESNKSTHTTFPFFCLIASAIGKLFLPTPHPKSRTFKFILLSKEIVSLLQFLQVYITKSLLQIIYSFHSNNRDIFSPHFESFLIYSRFSPIIIKKYLINSFLYLIPIFLPQ
jgi:hypothetical protein